MNKKIKGCAPKTGERLFSVATGNLAPWMKASREAAELMEGQDGFVGVAPMYPDGTLFFYASRAEAVRARNVARAKGIECGDNICVFKVGLDGVPEMLPIGEQEDMV